MNDKNISEQFRVTGIVYGALIFGLITFFAIAMFIVENKKFEPIQSIDEIFKLLIPLAGFAVMFLARSIYYKNIIVTRTFSKAYGLAGAPAAEKRPQFYPQAMRICFVFATGTMAY